MRKMQESKGLDELIESGSSGFYPLFYSEWIHESLSDACELRKMTFSKAAQTVHRVYKNIERHSSLERKKTALGALQGDERKDFVLSFLKMVEYRTLDRIRELH